MVVEGVHTTIPFLQEVVRDAEFCEGMVDTGFLDRFLARKAEEGGG
jgi:biotin carboxylase